MFCPWICSFVRSAYLSVNNVVPGLKWVDEIEERIPRCEVAAIEELVAEEAFAVCHLPLQEGRNAGTV